MTEEIVAEYDYRDETGQLLFQVVRKPGKRFLQRKPDGAGGWIWKLNGQRRVPYRFRELLAAKPEEAIWIAEGERDVHSLVQLGLIATCNPGGAGKWHTVANVVATALQGRNVLVISDADEPGRKHAKHVVKSLLGVAKSIILKEPPRPYKDVTDLLDDGGHLGQLIEVETRKEPETHNTPEGVDGKTADRTDLRNSERLIEWFGCDLKHCSPWKKWMAWNRQIWIVDELGVALQLCKETTRKMMILSEVAEEKAALAEAEIKYSQASDEDKRAATLVTRKARADRVHAEKSQDYRRINSMLSMARCDPAIAVMPEHLDRDPMLLNVRNGTLDLRTGELRSHRREDLLTKLAPVFYDHDAKAPTWEKFILRSMGSEDLVKYLQKIIGYAITGNVSEQIVVFFYGAGANGKSTFLSTMHALLGDYAGASARNLLLTHRGERHSTELADLFGRRFVTCSEIPDGQAFDEALVKDLTGGDKVSCRRMREDHWSFDSTHKFFLAGNYKPAVRGDDEGIWRRMKLIPWTVVVPETERDKTLGSKLKEELSGILSWAVRGCLEWQKHGLGTPDSVTSATKTYRDENDLFKQFVKLRVHIAQETSVPRNELRLEYEAFCRELGAEPLGAKRFSARLRELGARDTTARISTKDFHGNVINSVVRDAWGGMRLKSDTEREAV